MEILISGHTIYIDEEDHHLIRKFRWSVLKGHSRMYVSTQIPTENVKKKKRIYLHHLVAGYPPEGHKIYFADGNPLNCSRSNIEFITYSTASHLSATKKESKRQFRGVLPAFYARIKVANRLIHIGDFETEEEAARAYNLMALRYFGTTAELNVIE